ncbi:hypothetical protein C8R44DRAFT_37112 [Mycena epipterygia]|nr:hypothetical protein C8R44DRAFT_37112 [Mycena epipterygia]
MPTVSYPGGNPTLLSPSSYMPPFTRHLTLGSIHSWWSDRNPPGPTMDLHAASKPFMKFLYRRQVLDFIKRNDLKSIDSPPLSNETLQIYSDYLAFKYISPSTKTRILSALFRRLLSEADASAMAHSPVVYQVTELLHFPDTEIRRWACWIICMLSRHESLVVIVLRFEPLHAWCPLLATKISKSWSLQYMRSLGSPDFNMAHEPSSQQTLSTTLRNYSNRQMPLSVDGRAGQWDIWHATIPWLRRYWL